MYHQLFTPDLICTLHDILQTYGPESADTSIFLATSSAVDLKSEKWDIQVQATLLGETETVYDDHLRSQTTAVANDITYCGFDTLSDYRRSVNPSDRVPYEALKAEATCNVAAGIWLADRMKDTLKAVGLDCEEELVLTERQTEQFEIMSRPSPIRKSCSTPCFNFLANDMDDRLSTEKASVCRILADWAHESPKIPNWNWP
ncbi:hypothetical protein DFH07DRAFT_777613 [Mycena maculata]|uniref:Uncharacterized protein n=1 Tax=Mycena maculata TaxID=230809 RepID=A0AAD7III5_9AGAR|nr:hypothetical protein DFH07DRAFT_777613 [Mycena maculata]